METPRPLEETDPWLAEQIRLIAHGKHEVIKALKVSGDQVFYIPQKPVMPQKVGRNDPCSCGSKKKYKHCCGR